MINSFGKYKNPKNEILIQKMINKSEMSGVMTTCDLKNNSPYYNINYYKGTDTSVVTSGKKIPKILSILKIHPLNLRKQSLKN